MAGKPKHAERLSRHLDAPGLLHARLRRLVPGPPEGDPIAQIRYADVAGVELKQGKLTTRADIALSDGRAVAFETRRKGANKSNTEVFELLVRRFASRGATARAA